MTTYTPEEYSKKLLEVSKKIEKDLEESVEKDALELMADTIRTRTRKGFGVSENNAPKEKLKPLSENYKKQRKRDKKLSSETSPSKSNLTRHNNLLKSITSDKEKVFIKGEEQQRIAEYVSVDRPFMNLSRPEVKRIIKFLTEEINKLWNKYL